MSRQRPNMINSPLYKHLKILMLTGMASLFLLSGCVQLAFVAFGGVRPPRREPVAVQEKYLQKHGLSSTDLYFLTDSAVNRFRKEPYKPNFGPGFKVNQCRLFGKDGYLLAHYASCDGYVKWYFTDFPPVTYAHDTTHTLARDLIWYETEAGEPLPLNADSLLAQHDYVMVFYWAKYLGVMSRSMMKKIEAWAAQYSDKDIRIIKVNIGELDLPEDTISLSP